MGGFYSYEYVGGKEVHIAKTGMGCRRRKHFFNFYDTKSMVVWLPGTSEVSSIANTE